MASSTLYQGIISADVIIDIAQAFAAADRIRDMRPRAEEHPDASLLEAGFSDDNEKQGVKIELRHVCFKYPTRDVPVLDDLSMTVSLLVRRIIVDLTFED